MSSPTLFKAQIIFLKTNNELTMINFLNQQSVETINLLKKKKSYLWKSDIIVKKTNMLYHTKWHFKYRIKKHTLTEQSVLNIAASKYCSCEYPFLNNTQGLIKSAINIF